MTIKTDARRLAAAKRIIGLTGQNQNLQALTAESPGQVIKKLARRCKVRREKLTDNGQPCMLTFLAAPLPAKAQNPGAQ
jgi:hypothetical protein